MVDFKILDGSQPKYKQMEWGTRGEEQRLTFEDASLEMDIMESILKEGFILEFPDGTITSLEQLHQVFNIFYIHKELRKELGWTTQPTDKCQVHIKI